MLVCADMFEDYIGELQMAMAVSVQLETPESEQPTDPQAARAKQQADSAAMRAKLMALQQVWKQLCWCINVSVVASCIHMFETGMLDAFKAARTVAVVVKHPSVQEGTSFANRILDNRDCEA